MLVIGIDPGQSGGIAWWSSDGGMDCCKMPETERDVVCRLTEICELANDRRMWKLKAYIERVHSMPGQGVASSFKFGQSYGFLRGCLNGLDIPFDEVTPQKWQASMGCRTKGDKNVSKSRAQQLWPGLKITHAVADALLICEHGRRTEATR